MVSLTSFPISSKWLHQDTSPSSFHFLTLTSSNVSQYYKFLARRQETVGVEHKWKRSSSIARILNLPLSVFSTAFHLTSVHCAPAPVSECILPVQCPVSLCGPILPLNGTWHGDTLVYSPQASMAGIFSFPFRHWFVKYKCLPSNHSLEMPVSPYDPIIPLNGTGHPAK